MQLNPKSVVGLDTGRLGLWNPANLLTFGRLIVGAFALVAFELDWLSTGVAVLLIAISAATDLDGYLARRLDCASDFGRFLDPLVDKLFLALVGTWAILRVGNLWPLMFALIFLHFLISVHTVKTKSIAEIRATNFGRRAMAVTLFTVVFALYVHNVADESDVLRMLAGFGLTIAVVVEVRNLMQIRALTKQVQKTE